MGGGVGRESAPEGPLQTSDGDRRPGRVSPQGPHEGPMVGMPTGRGTTLHFDLPRRAQNSADIKLGPNIQVWFLVLKGGLFVSVVCL